MAAAAASSSSSFRFLFLFVNVVVVNLLLGRARAWGSSAHNSNNLKKGYYKQKGRCPNAEPIIRSTLEQAFAQDRGIAAALLRLHFHDCFVRGCDASVLLDGPNTEKTAPPNLSLNGFEIIDDIKAQLENACPGVVSCADVLAYAARDIVVLAGGRTWEVLGGRRDGKVSIKSEALEFLPPPSANVSTNTQIFARVGLSQEDMIILSGAHTIGDSHCSSFVNRIYNFNATFFVDPTLDPKYAQQLQKLCAPPHNNPDPNIVVSMDPNSPTHFDNSYYTNLKSGRGLFTSDSSLFSDPRSRDAVIQYSLDTNLWFQKFAQSMINMGSIIVERRSTKTEIRKNCRVVNPDKH